MNNRFYSIIFNKNHEEEKSNYDDKKLTLDSHKEGITPDGAPLRRVPILICFKRLIILSILQI